MKTRYLRIGIGLLGLLLGFAWSVAPAAARTPAEQIPWAYLPFLARPAPYVAQEIVADHRYTDVSDIPDYWIEQARKLTVHYAHTSHGNQILVGLKWLEARDARFNVDIQASDEVVLPADTTALRIYDGNNYGGNNYITPDMFWESEDGIAHTNSVADTGLFNISLWTWCGQMSSYEDSQIQQYIDTIAQFVAERPTMDYIFYTGHTDGSLPGSDLWRHNNMVRQYVLDHDLVLFDFADIESYDPEGNFYQSGSDACEWCDDWCTAHPTNFECQSVPTSCDHTHGLQCTLKAQAFWWMLARLAGWDGTPAH